MTENADEERFEIFDERGVLVGTAPRSRVHAEGLWHKSVNVFLFDDDGRLWIQRRVPWKDICGGAWDLSVAEHLLPGESWEAGALRGLKEELGVPAVELTPLGSVRRLCFDQPEQGIFDHELKQVFRGTWSGSLSPDPTEVDAVEAVVLSELAQRIETDPGAFTPWFLDDLDHTGMLDTRG